MSSRKNGPKNSAGARGKKKAREVIKRPNDMTNDEVVETLEKEGVSRVKQLMRTHDQLAVDTLAAVAGDEEAPAGARVSASTRILEWAHGKPVPISGNTSGVGSGNGLTITINRFFDKEEDQEPITIEGIVEASD